MRHSFGEARREGRLEPLVACGVACLLLAVAQPRTALAWPDDPLVNVRLSTGVESQSDPMMIPDGAGGAIVVWRELWDNYTRLSIYAQHVMADGAIDPNWPAIGTELCSIVGRGYAQNIVSDGAGGAIVAWYDYRNGDGDIYARRLLANGLVDLSWPDDGVALCTAVGTQGDPHIVADGSGGAIVTWVDNRAAANWGVYAQHVLGSGLVDPSWPVDGRAIPTPGGVYESQGNVSDGFGGAIVIWADSVAHVRAQHVLASGEIDSGWPAAGLFIGTQYLWSAGIVTDMQGGAIVAWGSATGFWSDIYAQHILMGGVLDPTWPEGGQVLCASENDQWRPELVSDGAGGAIVAWDDRGIDFVLGAQHVLANGEVDPTWPTNGTAVLTSGGFTNFGMAPDGLGGAVVAWQDQRGGSYDIYAQRLLADGGVDPAWPVDGRAICTAPDGQWAPHVLPSGSGGAIVAWADFRSSSRFQVYAQRVSSNSQLGDDVVGIPDGFPVASGLELDVRPNPARSGALTVQFGLASGAAASLELLDVAGRRIVAQELGAPGSGRHEVDLGAGRNVPAGLYFVRLKQGVEHRVRRVVVAQ